MRVSVDGLAIAYERAGQGDPVILLHGIGANAGAWRRQLDALADAFDLIAWDTPGYGGSDDPPGAWSMADYADCLAAFMETLGVTKAHVVGQSWGGVLAQELYGRHPGRVRSLVLANTYAGGRSQPDAQREASLNARLRALETMTPAEMARARAPAVLAPNPSPALLAETEAMLAQIRPPGYRRAAIAISEADARPIHARIAVPTLVVVGEHDGIIAPAESAKLRDWIPGAEMVVVPGSGHLTNMERADEFNDLLWRWLTACAS